MSKKNTIVLVFAHVSHTHKTRIQKVPVMLLSWTYHRTRRKRSREEGKMGGMGWMRCIMVSTHIVTSTTQQTECAFFFCSCTLSSAYFTSLPCSILLSSIFIVSIPHKFTSSTPLSAFSSQLISHSLTHSHPTFIKSPSCFSLHSPTNHISEPRFSLRSPKKTVLADNLIVVMSVSPPFCTNLSSQPSSLTCTSFFPPAIGKHQE